MKRFTQWALALAICMLALPICASAEGAADYQGPDITAVSVDRLTVNAGESIFVTIDAKDDASGVVCVKTHLGGLDNTVTMHNETQLVSYGRDGFLEKKGAVVEIPISYYMPAGDYALDVSVLDAAGRLGYFSVGPDMELDEDYTSESLRITVNNDHSDAEAPVFTQAYLDKTEIKVGEELTMYVDASDALSGFEKFSAVFAKKGAYEDYRPNFTIYGRVDESSTACGTECLSGYEMEGEYELVKLILSDHVGNRRQYGYGDSDTPLPVEMSITVLPNADTEGPKLNSLEFDRLDAKAGEVIPFSMEADEPVSRGTFEFRKIGGAIWDRFTGYIFTGTETTAGFSTLELSRYLPSGDYVLRRGILRDFADQSSYYYPVLAEEDYAPDNHLLPEPITIHVENVGLYNQPSFATWTQDAGGWYLKIDGEENAYLTNGWYADHSGMCYLGEDGYPVTDRWIGDEYGWSYVDANGYLVTNSWVKDSSGWCYVANNGYAVTDTWMQDSMGWCYLDGSGRMAKSCWVLDYQGWCYLDENGYMVTNRWVQDSQGWCYLDGTGHALTNAWMADSQGWCYLDGSGRMAKSCWVMDSQGWCYLNDSGYVVTDCWAQDSQGWCYLDDSGRMATNRWMQDSHGWCYLGEDGRMVKNQYVDDSTGPQWIGEDGYLTA